MTTATKKTTALDAAQQRRDAIAATVASWQQQREDAQAKVEQLEGQTREALDPSAIADLTSKIMEAGTSVRVAEDAEKRAAESLAAAEAALDLAKADDLDRQISEIESEISRHRQQTKKLRAALEDHSGTEWQPKLTTVDELHNGMTALGLPDWVRPLLVRVIDAQGGDEPVSHVHRMLAEIKKLRAEQSRLRGGQSEESHMFRDGFRVAVSTDRDRTTKAAYPARPVDVHAY